MPASKINADWLLDAQPLRIWLAARSDLPVVGPLLGVPAAAYLFSCSPNLDRPATRHIAL